MNLHKVVRIVGGPALRGLGASSWEQPGHMFYRPNEEALASLRKALRRRSGGSRTVFFVVVDFSCASMWKWAATFTF